MADTITAKGSESKFRPHPDGQYVAQCVDTIDLGEKVEDFPGSPKKLSHKCALVFRTGEKNPETGDYIDIAQEFTVSMGEKANLRRFLEQWRGKPYTEEQAKAGVPVDKLVGQPALLTIAQKVSRNGRPYAVISSCVGVPRQMQSAVTTYSDYDRAPYWADRKEEYAAGAAAFRAANAAPPDEDYAPIEEPTDDLPF